MNWWIFTLTCSTIAPACILPCSGGKKKVHLDDWCLVRCIPVIKVRTFIFLPSTSLSKCVMEPKYKCFEILKHQLSCEVTPQSLRIEQRHITALCLYLVCFCIIAQCVLYPCRFMNWKLLTSIMKDMLAQCYEWMNKTPEYIKATFEHWSLWPGCYSWSHCTCFPLVWVMHCFPKWHNQRQMSCCKLWPLCFCCVAVVAFVHSVYSYWAYMVYIGRHIHKYFRSYFTAFIYRLLHEDFCPQSSKQTQWGHICALSVCICPVICI